MRIDPVCQGGIRCSLHKYKSGFALHPLIRDNTPLSLYKSDFILPPFKMMESVLLDMLLLRLFKRFSIMNI